LKHGAVPITVAKMLNRQLRIHVVGIEKELNFLDLFKELAFLLPEDLKVSTTPGYWYASWKFIETLSSDSINLPFKLG
jgi:hypothetical protein